MVYLASDYQTPPSYQLIALIAVSFSLTIFANVLVAQWLNNGRGSAVNRALDVSTYPGQKPSLCPKNPSC